MLDITELKKLQETALRTEEIKVLGEISARFAHEMRNPLTTAGGFARRLRDSLPEDDKHRKFADIIVEEVARLEHILKIILSSIEPFTLSVSDVDLNHLLHSLLQDLQDQIEAKGIDLTMSFSSSVTGINGDEELLGKALGNLLKHSVLSMPAGEKLFVSTMMEDENPVVIMRKMIWSSSFFPVLREKPKPQCMICPVPRSSSTDTVVRSTSSAKKRILC
ncbi:MAG: hypothetical protein JRF52_14095 [Deltaproteobacteria bacterium]|nr:hypothetical protein [Deltaproteobacteria bacterium]